MAVDPDLPAPPTRHPLHPLLLGSVAIGGAAGALARYGLGVAYPVATGDFPATTLVINLTGALLLAVLVGVVVRTRAPQWVRPLLGTGVLGGYTTFSTFAVDTDRLVSTDHVGLALGYVAASLLGGLAATALGTALTTRRAAT